MYMDHKYETAGFKFGPRHLERKRFNVKRWARDDNVTASLHNWKDLNDQEFLDPDQYLNILYTFHIDLDNGTMEFRPAKMCKFK